MIANLKPDTRNPKPSRSSRDTTEDSEDDIRFDYELRDPLSLYGVAIIVSVILLLLLLALLLHFL